MVYRCQLVTNVGTQIFFVNPQIAKSAVANPQISEVCQFANHKSVNV
jgi:hypothetical protein